MKYTTIRKHQLMVIPSLVYRPYHVLCPLQERDDGGDLVLHRQQTTTLDLNRLQLELGGSHVFTTGSQVRPKSLDFLRIKNIQKVFYLYEVPRWNKVPA